MNNQEKTPQKKLFELLILENTKILYEGINNMYNVFITEKKINKDLTVKQFVFQEYLKCQTKEDPKFLSQNVNHDFFMFINKYVLENQLCYKDIDSYDKTQNLKEVDLNSISLLEKYLNFCININTALYRDDKQTIYYSYNKIATDIVRLFKYNFCYLVYSDNIGERILDTSDYKDIIELNTNDVSRDIYKQVNKHKKKRAQNSLTIDDTIFTDTIPLNKVFTNENSQECYDCASICIDLPRNEYENELKSIYIILLKKQNSLNSKTIDIGKETIISAAFPLSFKYKLQALFKRDISALLSLNYNNSYDDIEKISKGDGLEILHITDLHITTDNFEEIKSLIYKKTFTNTYDENVFDLLIITGDVAQGNCSASELENNYDCAVRIITLIANKIWSNNGNIRSDWRKRILITTGNHDYAFMNELYAIESNRKLKYGQVAEKEGSTMVKFAYFINFIRKIQDISIGEYIDNDLNEIREYKQLDLSICSLNSCGSANPLRTNKVKLDFSRLSKNIDDSSKRNYICAVHHVPEYNIDYFIDRQDIKWEKLKSDEDVKSLLSALRWVGYIFGSEGVDYDILKQLVDSGTPNCLSNSLSILQKYESAIGSELVEKALLYLHNPDNEYAANWKKKMELDYSFSKQDKENYKIKYDELNNKLNFITTLGGHEHSFSKRNNDVYAGEKFFKKDSSDHATIHYGAVHIVTLPSTKTIKSPVNYINKVL